MTNDMFFDTDCISSFLWINDTNILQALYAGKIVLPDPVYQEMSNPCIPHIKRRVVLLEALEKGIISEQDGNVIWQKMLDKNCKLPAGSFTEYIKDMKE